MDTIRYVGWADMWNSRRLAFPEEVRRLPERGDARTIAEAIAAENGLALADVNSQGEIGPDGGIESWYRVSLAGPDGASEIAWFAFP